MPEAALVGTFDGVDLFTTYRGGDGNDVVLISPWAAVPEPAALLLLAGGLLGLGLAGARHRRR